MPILQRPSPTKNRVHKCTRFFRFTSRSAQPPAASVLRPPAPARVKCPWPEWPPSKEWSEGPVRYLPAADVAIYRHTGKSVASASRPRPSFDYACGVSCRVRVAKVTLVGCTHVHPWKPVWFPRSPLAIQRVSAAYRIAFCSATDSPATECGSEQQNWATEPRTAESGQNHPAGFRSQRGKAPFPSLFSGKSSGRRKDIGGPWRILLRSLRGKQDIKPIMQDRDRRCRSRIFTARPGNESCCPVGSFAPAPTGRQG